MKYRPLCQICNKNPVAVNYKRDNVTYYRSHCDTCIRKKKKIPAPRPLWMKKGYKKKPHCEKCGFKAKYKTQLFVFYVDGDLSNAAFSNLRTICSNCQIEVAHEGLGWRQGDLCPDN